MIISLQREAKRISKEIIATMEGINFYSSHNVKLIMYPSSLTLEMLIEDITAMQEGINLLKFSSQQEKIVASSAFLFFST